MDENSRKIVISGVDVPFVDLTKRGIFTIQ